MKDIRSDMKHVVDIRTMSENVSKRYLLIKRVFDVILSLVAIVFFLPFTALIAVVLAVGSSSPVITYVNVYGFKARIFKLYRFSAASSQRSKGHSHGSVIIDTGSYSIHKGKQVRFLSGAMEFIEKTQLYKLPQLFNVLNGDMSIVGPKPLPISEIVGYRPWYSLRLSAKPGMTCLWHIKKSTYYSFDEMVRMDIKYIRERNFIYDLMIILRTIPTMFRELRKG